MTQHHGQDLGHHRGDREENRIPVWVKALDPLSQFGLVHTLRQRPEINLIGDADLPALLPAPCTHCGRRRSGAAAGPC